MRKQLSDEEKHAYAAGIVDGEGTIAIIRQTDNRYNCRTNYNIRISVGSTDECLIQWLQIQFGGNIRHRKAKKENHKPLSEWYITGEPVGNIIEKLYPYLLIKLAQARVVLSFIHRIQPDMEENFFKEMATLNKRGI